MGDGGKGSAPRPITDWDKFEANWEKIFGGKYVDQKKVQREESSDRGVHVETVDAPDSEGAGQ